MAKCDGIELLSEIISATGSEEEDQFRRVTGFLIKLGYTPHRERVRGLSLAFKSKRTKQTIAKISVESDTESRLLYSFKFYACKCIPQKFSEAVKLAVQSTNGQYRCVGCGVCRARVGERGYITTFPEGKCFLRCGAYVVKIPSLCMDDLDDLEQILSNQHAYFLSIL